MSIETIITQLAVLEAEITGVHVAHDDSPEALNEFPAFVNYPTGGPFIYSASGPNLTIHTIHADLHVSRSVLPHDENQLRPFVQRVWAKLADNLTCNGTCEHLILVRYDYGRLGYGAQETLGIRFTLSAKEKDDTITVST